MWRNKHGNNTTPVAGRINVLDEASDRRFDDQKSQYERTKFLVHNILDSGLMNVAWDEKVDRKKLNQARQTCIWNMKKDLNENYVIFYFLY